MTINKKIEEGFDKVKQNQIEAEECQQTRHELSEKNADNREQATINNDSKRETRWKKRYWGAAIVALICVLYVGSNMNRQQALIKKLTNQVNVKNVLIEDLSNQVESKTIKKIWFDRKREHTNEGFAKVDDKYPAGFEIWDGKKLIERWHWKIDGQPKTDQFGEYITRCIALYDENDEYAGFTQTVMDHFPTQNAGELGFYKNNPKAGSIAFTLNLKEEYLELSSDDMGIRWERGKLKHTYQIASNVKYNYSNETQLMNIIQNIQHYKYLAHISAMFPFIEKEIIKPFDEINPSFAKELDIKIINDAEYAETVVRLAITLKQKDGGKRERRRQFAKIINELPLKQKQEWQRFTKAMEKNPIETIKFIEEKYKDEQQEAPDLKQIFSWGDRGLDFNYLMHYFVKEEV